MKLVLIAACLAVCQGAKLNRGYLPPESAKTAGGDGDILQAPFRSLDNSPTRLPAGSYVNEFEGVVIDADAAGTRATHSGLGNSRETYGSTDSKVGEAAFRESNANKDIQNQGFTVQQNQQNGHHIPNVNENKQHLGHLPNVAGVRQPLLQPGENQIPVLEAERFHASRDRASNIITYQNDIGITDFNYAFQTDNGISAAEIGMALDGVKSKGGYSYTGDDGQVYTISYTADEAGYRPQGSHIPTPPPIPAEILKALEQNARDEAAGIVDDGSYDAKKYNMDHTKGNKPNDNKYNTFERRPVSNVITAINQNRQTNKANRNEDNRNNGQNQFPHANPGYTVNDKLISNFSNIRNQYENEFDILTNTTFNNNGPISNFKDLDDVTNQSQNVPLSQQKLQDKIEVPDSNGRPNSYQAPIATIQNQQQNNRAGSQNQFQGQLKPSSFQSQTSISGANLNQHDLNKPNSFFNSNNLQLRPESYQAQTSGLLQGQQNFNEKGSIFQTQFQNNINANQQSQQSFSSGITSTQFNTNRQQTNTPNNNLPNPTFNNQINNTFYMQTVTQTRPSSYNTPLAGAGGVNQKQDNNVGNLFSNTIQNRPTSYNVSISGSIPNQKPTANLNNVFPNQIKIQNIPTSFGQTVGTFQKQQSITGSKNIFSNPTSTQSRPAAYDASITGSIQTQQSIVNSGNTFSTPIITQAKPQASLSGVIQNQQQIGNYISVFSRPTQAQIRPSSYDARITGNIQKHQSIANSGNIFSTPISVQANPNLQATISESILNVQHNGNFGNVLSRPTHNPGRPTSFEASIIGNNENKKFVANTGSIFSSPNPIQSSIRETIQKQEQNARPIGGTYYQKQQVTNTNSAFSRPTTIHPEPTVTTSNEESTTASNNLPQQSKPGSQLLSTNGFANSGQSLDVQYESELYEYPKPATNLENVSTFQSKPNSYDSSFTEAIQRQQQQQSFIDSPDVNQYKNRNSANKQNEGTYNQGVTSSQFINVNGQQITSGNNDAPNDNTGRPSINKQDNIFLKPAPERTNSQTITGIIKQQHDNDGDHGSQLHNNLNKNRQNQGTFSSGVNSVQFLNSESPQTNEDSNSENGNFARPVNSQVNIFDNQIKTEANPNLQGNEGENNHQNQYRNQESSYQQSQENLDVTTKNNINMQISDSLSQFSSNVPTSPNFGSSFAQPLQNFGLHLPSSSFTVNTPNGKDNGYKNSVGLVAISSSSSVNDDFGSNFLHKKFSIRKQQELNQQGFTNFLRPNNLANSPVVISSNYKNQYSTTQPALAFSNLNSGNNYQDSTFNLFSSSQLNQPNPTPQTFGVNGSDGKLFTPVPARTLSTPKDTVEISQGISGITQASISSFPSLSSDSGNSNSASSASSLASQAIGSSLGANLEPSHSHSNLGLNLGFGNAGSSVSFQNQGEIYEYPKPEQNLPIPHKASGSDQSNSLPSNNVNTQTVLNNPVPTVSLETEENIKTESGPKLLPSRPDFISSSCCFSSQTTEKGSDKNNDGTGVSFESNSSTLQNNKEEFEGPTNPQRYDELGYHY